MYVSIVLSNGLLMKKDIYLVGVIQFVTINLYDNFKRNLVTLTNIAEHTKHDIASQLRERILQRRHYVQFWVLQYTRKKDLKLPESVQRRDANMMKGL